MDNISERDKYSMSVAGRLMRRSFTKYDADKNGTPNGIYRCFEDTAKLFAANVSVGYFLLTDTHLSFYVDYPNRSEDDQCGNKYGFVNTQIKDITSICANYERRFNFLAIFMGIIFALVSTVLMTSFPDMSTFATILCVLGCAVGAAFIIGAFSFMRNRIYKINIGTTHGGITVMGSSHSSIKTSAAWSNPMTVIYNARPIEYGLINFIEKVNLRITLLQERGEYAFDGYPENWEAM